MTYATFAGSSAPSLVTLDANFAKAAEQVAGTFTPTISGVTTAGAGTYTAQNGRYVRVGDLVFFSIFLGWSAHSGSGALILNNVLPFPSAAGAIVAPFQVMAQNLTYTGSICAYVSAGSSSINLRGQSSGAALATVSMDTSGEIYITGCYEAS